MDDVAVLSELILSSSGSPPPISNPAFLRLFLYCAKGNVTKAAERHTHYWSVRTELLGESTTFNEPSISALLSTNPFIATPSNARDTSGRRLIYVRPRFLDWSVFSLPTALSCVWFTINNLLLFDPVAAEHGVVIISNMAGLSLSNVSRAFFRDVARSVYGAMPLRVSAIRGVNNPPIFQYIFAFMKMFLPVKIRGRLEVIGGDHGRLLEVLPPASIPEVLGGRLEVAGDDI
ncbi:hypothetical protein TrVE_jg7818 [Triparma verrucosa]|uniref:CRAL-TRIO domain-containing protein n=1 Tax=Triparma verrucosa TaxID=1606542 RepID=A0A9W7C0N8_9STRA|nr:hypothetical protein TrVE_jg7818 [Triparma verrucosa]